MSSPTRAMIMAAGLGTRMRPLTSDRPKPLVEVGGKPLIDHAIDRLMAAGVTMIVVNLHYKAEMLKEHLAKRKDVEIRLSEESDGLLRYRRRRGESAGAVWRRALLHPQFRYRLGGRLWCGSRTHEAALGSDSDGRTALMAPMVTAMGYEGIGDFMMDGEGRLSRVPAGRVSPFAFPGVQIVHPRLFDNAPSGGFSTNMVWDRAIEKERLFGVRLDGVWIHVGTPQAVAEAEDYLADLAPAA